MHFAALRYSRLMSKSGHWHRQTENRDSVAEMLLALLIDFWLGSLKSQL